MEHEIGEVLGASACTRSPHCCFPHFHRTGLSASPPWLPPEHLASPSKLHLGTSAAAILHLWLAAAHPISDSAGTTKLPRAHWHRRGNSLKGCSTTLVGTAHGKWRCLAWTHVFQPMQKPAHSAWVWQWAEEPRWVQFLHGGHALRHL